MKKIAKTHYAFTLLEMLIVIVIIGILAVALIPRLMNVQARARDVQRKNDIQVMYKALFTYYYDYGSYPEAVCNLGTCGYYQVEYSHGDGGVLSDLVPGYLSEQIEDPSHPRKGYGYYEMPASEITLIASACEAGSIGDFVGLIYQPDNLTTSDYTRACPDGRPRDVIIDKVYETDRWPRQLRLGDDLEFFTSNRDSFEGYLPTASVTSECNVGAGDVVVTRSSQGVVSIDVDEAQNARYDFWFSLRSVGPTVYNQLSTNTSDNVVPTGVIEGIGIDTDIPVPQQNTYYYATRKLCESGASERSTQEVLGLYQ